MSRKIRQKGHFLLKLPKKCQKRPFWPILGLEWPFFVIVFVLDTNFYRFFIASHEKMGLHEPKRSQLAPFSIFRGLKVQFGPPEKLIFSSFCPRTGIGKNWGI